MNFTSNAKRVRINITGVVQGVGFRPFVYRLAAKWNLCGFVRNLNGRVEIEIQGDYLSIDNFLNELATDAPPLSRIEELDFEVIELGSENSFKIESSSAGTSGKKFLPPDAATCQDCLEELFDPDNRRYRYPFINCTNCGPRFTIIESLPYDREATTMRSFKMCALCQSEYNDPSSRRFHAEPIACSSCGPKIRWRKSHPGSESGEVFEEDALQSALDALENDEVIAVKGLGGFHLIANASSQLAVEHLRSRKRRSRKPMALMMRDLDMVREHCLLNLAETSILTDSSRPIVLLSKRLDSMLPSNIAPGTNLLGVMLPYTPLHHLLLSKFDKPVVASSANLSEEPIAIDNDEATVRLKNIAYGFLDHDRVICSRYDDSVVRLIGDSLQIMRRSRGIAPKTIQLPFHSQKSILACGGHLKNTFCLIEKDKAYLSQHIGDLENLETSEHFMHSLENYLRLFDLNYESIVHDMHPDYLSTSIAQELGSRLACPVLQAQHHHAHIVSCMVDNNIPSRKVIGVAFDGSGYGEDETVWGGEFLIASYSEYERIASFQPVALPGGFLAIKQPWRMALSYLFNQVQSKESMFESYLQTIKNEFGEKTVDLVLEQIQKKINTPMSSSCGRLFDAVASLLGICHVIEYEAQAAIELEALAAIEDINELRINTTKAKIALDRTKKITIVKGDELLLAVLKDLQDKIPKSQIAARFHFSLASNILEVCRLIRESKQVNDVCLGGGVFQNKVLLSMSKDLLSEDGFNVFSPRQVPANDGGLSLGQATIALAQMQAISFKGVESCA